jgi:hypothetical protein
MLPAHSQMRMWLLCHGGDLAKANLSEPDSEEVTPVVLGACCTRSCQATLPHWPDRRDGDLALMGDCPPQELPPAENALCMCSYAADSHQAPLFSLSLTPGQSYPWVPTSADRAFWGFWGRLGAFYAPLRELFEP